MCADLEMYIAARVGSVNRYVCEDSLHNRARQSNFDRSFNWSFWPRRYEIECFVF